MVNYINLAVRKKVIILGESFSMNIIEEELDRNIIFDKTLNKDTIKTVFKLIHEHYGKAIKSLDTIIITFDSLPIACFVDSSKIPIESTLEEIKNKVEQQKKINEIFKNNNNPQLNDLIQEEVLKTLMGITEDPIKLKEAAISRMENCSLLLNINHYMNSSISPYNPFIYMVAAIPVLWFGKYLLSNFQKKDDN